LLLGQANGFDTEEVPLQGLKEAQRHHWLRLWETMRFLNLYITCNTPPQSIKADDDMQMVSSSNKFIAHTAEGESLLS
jgi:hypothetical protein